MTPARPLPSGRPFGGVEPTSPPTSAGACGSDCGCGPSRPPLGVAGVGQRTVRVCPPRVFDFAGLDADGAQTVTVADRIHAVGYSSVDLVVRFHSDATIASDGWITIMVVSDGHTPDDPSLDFFSAPLGGQGGLTFSGSSPPVAGQLVTEAYTAALGAWLAVRVLAQQSDPVGTNISARMSIDLVLRER